MQASQIKKKTSQRRLGLKSSGAILPPRDSNSSPTISAGPYILGAFVLENSLSCNNKTLLVGIDCERDLLTLEVF